MMKTQIELLIQQIRTDIERRKNMPKFGVSPDASMVRIKTINATQRSFTAETVEQLLAVLEEYQSQETRVVKLVMDNEDAWEALFSELKLARLHGFKVADENKFLRWRIKEIDLLCGKLISAMQTAVIEDEHGEGYQAGMEWIANTLFGLGELPPPEEKDALAYFKRKLATFDVELAKCIDYFTARRKTQDVEQPPVEWSEAKEITEVLDMEIRNLIDNPTEDNAVCLVRSVMERYAQPLAPVNEKVAFEAWLNSDYSPDRSGATSEMDEQFFIELCWHVWRARAALSTGETS